MREELINMKSVGIIVEYNPFHNGHAYHVQQAKTISNADIVIAVMSGYFLQRGEPALVSKWARTNMALRAGVDIVIELPYAFATQKAEVFANGAISLLHALGVDSLCFGSEEGNITPFHELVNFYKKNEGVLDVAIKKEIKKGVSYPKAAASAFHVLKEEGLLDLSLPNNILGFHYVKAIKEKQAEIEAFTVARTKSGYHDPAPKDRSIASATSIRNELKSANHLKAIQSFVPNTTLAILEKEYASHGQFVSWEKLFPFLKYRLLTAPLDELQMIYEIEEGIESRLVSRVKDAQSFQKFIESVKTKRFTWTRLQRMCTHILTNAKKCEMAEALETKEADYIRLLGMSLNGQLYLNQMKKNISLPFISKYSKHHQDLLKLDVVAAHTYGLAFPPPVREQFIKAEYTMHPIIQSPFRL